jgi:catechol-2,3-dioxygenase
MAIKDLGEFALRVKDFQTMRQFYENVIGLSVWRESKDPQYVFYKVADGYAGHTHFFALFDRSTSQGYLGLDPARTTLDHIAFEISLSDYDKEKTRLERLGTDVRTKEFLSFHWRSLFLTDPEGNTVELVCYDETVK